MDRGEAAARAAAAAAAAVAAALVFAAAALVPMAAVEVAPAVSEEDGALFSSLALVWCSFAAIAS